MRPKKRKDLLRAGRKVRFGERVYMIERLKGGGGSGEVYLARMGERSFALKIFFPFYQMHLFSSMSSEVPRTIRESLTFQEKEYRFLSQLSHPNIVRVFDAGEVELTKQEQEQVPIKDVLTLPAMVMEYVDGDSFGDAITGYSLSADEIAHILLRIARALEYLHAERRYMHTDIKSANIMIRKVDHEPILIDFALCKNLNFAEVSASERTRLLGDWDLFPKSLATDHRLKAMKEQDGTRQEISDLCFPALDLFQVGKLLKDLRPKYEKVFDQRDLEYLEALAGQLRDWDAVRKWGPKDLVPAFRRLGPGQFAPFGIPELATPSSAEKTVTIPPGIAIPITGRVDQILNNRSFRRLAVINQLCLLGQVYPGADYKRWVHVLLAYDLARELVVHLLGTPLFRVLFDRQAVQQLLFVVLLHDINHFPFLHIFQESGIPNLDRLQVVDLFCKGEATGEKELGSSSIYDLLGEIGVEPQRFKRLLFGKHHEQEGEIDQAISSVLNSGVDVDKLSYLVLDSHFTGVRYGAGIDFPCILKGATVGRLDNRTVHLAFTDRAIPAVENVVMTRFWNFRSLYWHHTNRSIMAMILHVVRRLYVEQKRPVQEYLLQTKWFNDIEALRYLDSQFQSHFGHPSIVSGLFEDRRHIYKRFYTVRAGIGDDADDALYAECKRMDYQSEIVLCRNLAKMLTSIVAASASGATVSDDEVLVDIPRREMDTGGPAYIWTGADHLIPLANLSDPIRSISANYEKLTKRVRFFVSPRIARVIDKRRRLIERDQWQTIVKEAMEKARSKSQVQ